MIPRDLQRNGQHRTTPKGVLPRIPNGMFSIFPKRWHVLSIKTVCTRLPAERGETGQDVRNKVKDTRPAAKGISLSARPPGSHPKAGQVRRCAPAGRARAAPPQRLSPARPETYRSPRTPSGKCSGRRPPRPGSAPPSGGGARQAQAFTCLIFPWLGAGRRGARSAPTSLLLPSPAHGGRGRLLPRLLQQPTSNRPLGATAQAPATRRPQRSGLRAPTDVVTPAQRGLGDHSQQRENLDFFSPRFSRPLAPNGLNPRSELFRHAPQAGGFAGRVVYPCRHLGSGYR